VYLQFAVQLAGFPFDLDQGEGYDAWSAWMVNLGQLPYTSNADFPSTWFLPGPRVGRSPQRKNVIAASFCNRYLQLKGPSSAGP